MRFHPYLHHLAFAIMFLMTAAKSSAQTYMRADSFSFIESGDTLLYPYAGGMNCPQMSVKDLDGDGKKDLFIFDRTGSELTIFKNEGTSGSPSRIYSPTLASLFPDELVNWVLLRDFNCDGREDIFTGFNYGIKVFKDVATSGSPIFVLEKTAILSDYGLGNVALQVPIGDIPDINDIDNDGDLDILTFNSGGIFVEWHKNLSMETYGVCDSLIFDVADHCWGKFQEAGFDNNITLGVFCRVAPGSVPADPTSAAHSGSTLTSFDEDGDGDKELLLGDLLASNLVYLRNAGTASAALMDTFDFSFPSYDVPVEQELFNAAFFLDTDDDGDDDLVVAPNTQNVSYNYDNVWYFQNTGSASSVDLQFQGNNFLQSEMIDLGTCAYPALIDYNADGLTDIIAGNESYQIPSMDISGLSLYLNVGTTTHPVFNLSTRDLNGFSSVYSPKRFGFAPACADMDNDGDVDMLMGDSDGRITFFPNIAGPGNPVLFGTPSLNYKGIDVGQYSAIAIADINGDTLPDIVTGEYLGNLEYYENIGSASVPNFSSVAITKTFGKIDTETAGLEGFSLPFIYKDTSGVLQILVGSLQGNIWNYTVNPDSIAGGSFPLIDSTFHDWMEGFRSSITAGDLNADGRLEYIVGNIRGGLTIFTEEVLTSSTEPVSLKNFYHLFPNPSGETFTLYPDQKAESDVVMKIYDLQGTLLHQQEIRFSRNQFVFDASDFASGIYLVCLESGKGISHLKWVKQ